MYIRPGENEYNVYYTRLYCWMKILADKCMNEQEQKALLEAVKLLDEKRIKNA
jgi:hypothetical protein